MYGWMEREIVKYLYKGIVKRGEIYQLEVNIMGDKSIISFTECA